MPSESSIFVGHWKSPRRSCDVINKIRFRGNENNIVTHKCRCWNTLFIIFQRIWEFERPQLVIFGWFLVLRCCIRNDKLLWSGRNQWQLGRFPIVLTLLHVRSHARAVFTSISLLSIMLFNSSFQQGFMDITEIELAQNSQCLIDTRRNRIHHKSFSITQR